eukprot:5760130-Ditylum_brightwellii.AAC.1
MGIQKGRPSTRIGENITSSGIRMDPPPCKNKQRTCKSSSVGSGFLFAMRSCEYSKPDGSEEKRTITIRLQDIPYRLGKKWLPYTSPSLHIADSVSVLFHLQKSEKERGENVTMHRTRDSQLNPVVHWAFTVRRVMKIKSFLMEWPIDFIKRNGTIECIALTKIRSLIRASVQAYGEDKL